MKVEAFWLFYVRNFIYNNYLTLPILFLGIFLTGEYRRIYLYFYGELMEEKITDMLMEKIKEKIINNKNNKNIVICFSENEAEINLVKASLQSLKPESIIPFLIFVKILQGIQNKKYFLYNIELFYFLLDKL